MIVPDFTAPSLRFIEKGDGRQVTFAKVPVARTASDDPARSRYIDELLGRCGKADDGMNG